MFPCKKLVTCLWCDPASVTLSAGEALIENWMDGNKI